MLALVRELGADHLNLQADVRPYTLEECVPYIDGWRGLADEMRGSSCISKPIATA